MSSLVDEFLQETAGNKLPIGHFQPAIKIFVGLEETLIPDTSEDTQLQNFIAEVGDFLRRKKEEKKRTRGSQDNYDLKKWWKKNRFRPVRDIFSCPRYSFQVVNRDRDSLRDPPPEPLRRPYRLRVVEEKEEKEREKKHGKTREKDRKSAAKAGNYLPSDRDSRNMPGVESREVEHRNVSDATRKMKSLKKKHGVITWPIGCIASRLRKGQLSESSKFISERIEFTVERLNILKRLAQWGTLFLVEYCLADEDEETADKILNAIVFSDTGGQGGTKYWQGVLRFLQYGKTNSQELSVTKFAEVNANLPASMPTLQKKYIGLQRGIENLAVTLDTEFATNVVGRIELLAATVLQHNPELKEELNGINDTCPIRRFHLVNQHLPKDLRWQLSPKSSATDSFVTLSEECLRDILQVHKKHLPENWNTDTAEKGAFIVKLFGPDFGRNYKLLNQATPQDTVLYVSIVTNGLELSVQAIDPSKSAKSKIKKKASLPLGDAGCAARTKTLPSLNLPRTYDGEVPVNACYLGIDWGVTYIAGACAKFEEYPDIRHNLSMKSGAFREPDRKFSKFLEKRKKEEGISELELELTRLPEETTSSWFIRWWRVYLTRLRGFYNSKSMKKRDGT